MTIPPAVVHTPESSRRAAWIGVAVVTLALGARPWLPLTPAAAYAAAFIASSAVFFGLSRALARASTSARELAGLLGVLFVLRAALLVATPIGSDDFHRYLWDGKVQAAAISPYAHAPNAPELRALHSDALPRLVNHPDVKTPYFPLAQGIFRLAYGMAGEEVWGIKLVILLAEALTVAGTVLLLLHFGLPPARSLLYAASPLALFQFGLDAHIDAVGFPALVFGLLLCLTGRTVLGGALLGLSMAIKPVAALVALVLVIRARTSRERVGLLVGALASLAIVFLPYLRDPHVFDGVLTFARDWRFNGSVFGLLREVLGSGRRARLACAALLLVTVAVIGRRSKHTPTACAYAVLALLLFSPVVHPWYVGWLAVLLPFSPRPSALALVATVSLTSLTVVTYRASGVWIDYPLVRAAEYLPVFALLAWEIRPGAVGGWLEGDGGRSSSR